MASGLYPALFLSNVTKVDLYIEFDSCDEYYDRFGGLANLLACVNPKLLYLAFACTLWVVPDEYRCSTFRTYSENWTRLEGIKFSCNDRYLE